MRKELCCAVLFAAVCLAGAAPAAESVAWQGDFAAAEKVARSEKKNILILFTAPGWCGPCRSLEKGALASAAFAAFAKTCIPVRLDFSEQNKVTGEMRQIAGKFNVRGFPTVILLTSAGKEAGRIMGSMPEKSFMTELKRISGKK